jgi:hypothetical protein
VIGCNRRGDLGERTGDQAVETNHPSNERGISAAVTDKNVQWFDGVYGPDAGTLIWASVSATSISL